MTDAGLPLVFTRAYALSAGYTNKAVDWRISSGRWRVLRRAVFCSADAYQRATPEQRHLLAAVAVSLAMDAGEVVSHLSAALGYGWPSPLDVDDVPWTTLPGGRGATRRRHGRIRQVAPLPDSHVSVHQGLAVTSPARTVADCLRHLPAEESVPIADHAFAHGVHIEAVARILDWQAGWPYAARGRASLGLVDARRESWLESRSAVWLHRRGIAAPTCQVDLFDPGGSHVARVDFLWSDLGVVGEADGWGKYALTDGETAQWAALRAEKLREDRLRDLGYEVVRWTTAELLGSGAILQRRLERAIARARPDRVVGSRRTSEWPTTGDVPPAGWAVLASLAPHDRLLVPVRPYSLEPRDRASWRA